MTWCLVRADASAMIGTGHIMRCMALANRLAQSGVKSVFVSRILPDSLQQKLQTEGHDVVALPADKLPAPEEAQGDYGKWLGTTENADALSVISALEGLRETKGNPFLILCDHYGLGETWERLVGRELNAPILAIDDLSNRVHQCDYLLDMTYGKSASDYAGLLPAHCKTFVGAQYALLRPEFSAARPAALARRDSDFAAEAPAHHILISMGGMDKDNASLLVLKAIASLNMEALKIEVLVSKDGVHLDELQAFADTSESGIIIHGGSNDVAGLYAKADLCIGAAGSSTWERCCLGLPTINIVIADNQKTIARTLAAKGAIIDAGLLADLTLAILANTYLKPLIQDPSKRESLSLASRDLCDGQGIERIVLPLFMRNVKEGKTVSLRRADSADVQTVYDWQCLPETRRYANNRDIPSFPGHQAWMTKRLADAGCHFYIIQCDGKDAGSVRLDFDIERTKPETGPAAIISIFIDPQYFGLGVASAALDLAAWLHVHISIWAQVHSDNLPSLKLFERANYKAQGGGWHLLPPRV